VHASPQNFGMSSCQQLPEEDKEEEGNDDDH
jgi:hypothetical protein